MSCRPNKRKGVLYLDRYTEREILREIQQELLAIVDDLSIVEIDDNSFLGYCLKIDNKGIETVIDEEVSGESVILIKITDEAKEKTPREIAKEILFKRNNNITHT